MKKIGIIGVGGRTGTMFAFELKNFAQVFGIAKEREFNLIKKKKLFVKRGRKKEIFDVETIRDFEFPKIDFDFLFLTVKNPVAPAVKFYYQKIKEKNLKPPALILSQNGIGALEEADLTLKEIFGERAKEIQIFRISLLNPIKKEILNEKEVVFYSLPIKMGVAQFSGKNSKEIFEIFKKAKFKFKAFPPKEVKNLEYSKLFLNLIGMASAANSLSLKEGFSKKEIFKEEIEAIREFKKVVKAAKGKFLNLPGFPVKFFSFFFSLPDFFLFPLRNLILKLIEKGREKKPKEINEVEYYNGAVVKLGEKFKIETKVNKEILRKCLLKELG